MKRNFTFTFITLSSIIFLQCGTTKKNVYSFSDWQVKSDSSIVLKRANRINKLSIQNYTDTLFPNYLLTRLTNIEELVIYSDNWSNKIDQNSPDMDHEPIEIDRLYFDTLSLDLMINLKSLTLYGFTLDSFPIQLRLLKSLRRLNLIFCSIKEIPTDLSEFNNLESLDLTVNDIAFMPNTILLPSSLTKISLKNNKLTKVPISIISTQNLVNIDLSNRESTDYWFNQNLFTSDNIIKSLDEISENTLIENIYFTVNSCEEYKRVKDVVRANELTGRVRIYLKYGIKCNPRIF